MSDIEISQDMDRPYVFLGREVFGDISGMDRGIDVIDIHDPYNPKVIVQWRIEDSELHMGAGGKDLKEFKWNNRYYVVLSTQFYRAGQTTTWAP